MGAAGCSVGPDYSPPCVEVPGNWKEATKTCEGFEVNTEGELTYLDFWWQVFEDEKLNELEAWALNNNRNLFIAFERIEEYRALMGIAASDFYPQLTLNPLYTNTGELIKNYANPKNVNAAPALSPFRAHELYYYLPLNLSYEVDLWGRIQDIYDSAEYHWFAQQKDYEAVMLSLTSDLATAYFQLRAADAQIGLLTSVIQTRQKALKINQDRYEGKITFYADVALAAEEVADAELQYNEVVRQRQVLENLIAVLIGVPAPELCLSFNPLDGLPPGIPEGLPSELLLRRPDLAEAEYQTHAAHALVKEAYSEFFPSLTLTATGGFESPILKDFMHWISRYWMLGAQSNQIVFDGFKTPYNLQLQIARLQEANGEYQQLVLQSFQEVEDALTNIGSYAKEYENAWEATKWAKKANQLYIDRYSMGVIDYINVVNTERDLLNFQITLNAIQGYRYIATIQLIKALGGGWSGL